MLFGDDNPDREEDLVPSFQGELAKIDGKYSVAPIEIWQQNHLVGFFNKFPSLALRIKGTSVAGFYSHGMWSTFEVASILIQKECWDCEDGHSSKVRENNGFLRLREHL